MPLLPKEIEIAPDGLFELDPAAHPWSVAHVRSRQEKVLARWLAERGVPLYLPQIEAKTRRSGRTFTSHLPLFPGYVFFRGGRRERDLAVRSKVVANLIGVEDQQQLGAELRQLRELQLAGASLQPFVALAPGDAVRIDEGAFAGYMGIIDREKGRDRLVVRVSLIDKAVLVEFERNVLARR